MSRIAYLRASFSESQKTLLTWSKRRSAGGPPSCRGLSSWQTFDRSRHGVADRNAGPTASTRERHATMIGKRRAPRARHPTVSQSRGTLIEVRQRIDAVHPVKRTRRRRVVQDRRAPHEERREERQRVAEIEVDERQRHDEDADRQAGEDHQRQRQRRRAETTPAATSRHDERHAAIRRRGRSPR